MLKAGGIALPDDIRFTWCEKSLHAEWVCIVSDNVIVVTQASLILISTDGEPV